MKTPAPVPAPAQAHEKTSGDDAARAATVQDSRCPHSAGRQRIALSIEAARRSLANTLRRQGFDSAELDAKWNVFRNDADWKTLSADTRFAYEPIVSNITNLILSPLDCSQI